MNKSEVVVDGVSDISAGRAGAAAAGARRGAKAVPSSEAMLGRPEQLTVHFEGGRTGLLDTSEERGRVWADVLLSLREAGQPAYVEIDPRNRAITTLLLPREVTVSDVRPAERGVEVELVVSHAVHFVRRSNPNYDELVKELRRAQKSQSRVLVTETLDSHEIVDVRPVRRRAVRGR